MMWPKNLSGVGTLSDAGRWSTSSVEIRGSINSDLIFAVYSASCRCCARTACAWTKTPAVARAATADQRRNPEGRDILPPRCILGTVGGTEPGGSALYGYAGGRGPARPW